MVAVHVLRSYFELEGVVYRYFAFVPARFTPEGFDFYGGLPAAIWSWVTYNFLHGDLAHITINGLWMLAFGSAVAWRVGTVRFLAFSAVCGALGALTHLVMHWGEINPVIGASATISGHMAAAIRFIFRERGALGALVGPAGRHQSAPLMTVAETFQDRRSFAFLAVWAVINLAFGLSAVSFGGEGGSIAWEAHVGGFVAGLLLFGYFDPPRPPPRSYYHVV
jgi:membrane associated rhomboid family serine protease